jgi:hypothetical protein
MQKTTRAVVFLLMLPDDARTSRLTADATTAAKDDEMTNDYLTIPAFFETGATYRTFDRYTETCRDLLIVERLTHKLIKAQLEGVGDVEFLVDYDTVGAECSDTLYGYFSAA